MEKRDLYLIVGAIIAAVLILAVGNYTRNLTGMSVGTCIDSDDGQEPYIGGSVSFSESKAVYKDECYASGLNPKKFVKEYYCVGEATSERYKCEGGCAENAKGEGYCLEGDSSIDHSNE